MEIRERIEITERDLTLWQVELDEWIVAKCRIDTTIGQLKAKIESYKAWLEVFKEEMGA